MRTQTAQQKVPYARLIVALLAVALAGCGSSGGTAADSAAPTVTTPAPELKTVTIKQGAGYWCYLRPLGGVLFCWGAVPGRSPSPQPAIVGKNLSEYALLDNTLCLSAQVDHAPGGASITASWSGGYGPATYCYGPSNLNPYYQSICLFSGGAPAWSDVSSWPDLQTLPFVACASTLPNFLSAALLTDTSGAVAEGQVVCTVSGADLICGATTIPGGA